MAQDGMQQLLLDGIHAVQDAGKTGSAAAADIVREAADPELQTLLRHGSEVAELWRERLERAERMAGGDALKPSDSEIVKAIHHTGRKVAKHAVDDQSRDLGLVATGQLALHYYIASFGSLRAYAERLGMNEVASLVGQCLDEAKAEDDKHTELATKIASA